MKTSILCAVLGVLLTCSAQARTWTSADGSRTFEGTLRSYDQDTGEVTVIVNGRPMTFTKDKLSADDVAFLEAETEKMNEVDPEEALASSPVGSKVAKAKLHRLDGKRYSKAELEVVPEYYFLYYSASW
ncbi:MAG: hypothetical protein AAGF67_01170 [Verrucomicrobiota bacterium]